MIRPEFAKSAHQVVEVTQAVLHCVLSPMLHSDRALGDVTRTGVPGWTSRRSSPVAGPAPNAADSGITTAATTAANELKLGVNADKGGGSRSMRAPSMRPTAPL
jgi:hypothetical protein